MDQKVIQVGNSLGITIPQAFRSAVGLTVGGTVVVERKNESIVISPKKKKTAGIDPKFARMVEEFITEHEDVLQALAKR